MSLRAVIGCLGFLNRRARVVGQPGLTIYADAGIAAAKITGLRVADEAHKNEVTERASATRLTEMLADKQIDAAELAELGRLPATLTHCAERSHDISEQVRL